MYRYLRQIFNKPNNVHRLHRTVSGLDKKHIEKGNYIYKNFKKNHLPEIAESMRLLNIFGPGSLHRVQQRSQHLNFVDIWSGTLWGEIKTPHPPCQMPHHPSAPVTGNNPPLSSQKNSSSPPSKSSP